MITTNAVALKVNPIAKGIFISFLKEKFQNVVR